MLAVLGIVGIITVALVVAFAAAGCASSTTPSTDGDGDRDVNDGGDGDRWYDIDPTEDGDVEVEPDADIDDVDGDVEVDGDIEVEPDADIDGVDGDVEVDGDIEVEPDADVDENPPIPGYNPTAYNLGGSFRDLDVISSGKIRAFGGAPLRLLECDIASIDDVTCHEVADMPEGAGEAVDYKYRDGMKSLAVAVHPDENPIDLMFIDNETGVVDPHYNIGEVPMPGFTFSPTRPGGVTSGYNSALECERVFLPTANWLSVAGEDTFVRSTTLVFDDESTEAFPVRDVGYSSGVNVRALAMAEVEDAGENVPWLIGISSGSLDPLDDRHAAIDFMDPESVELHVSRSIDLGAVEFFALPEVKFNWDASGVYMLQKSPSQEFVSVDLKNSTKVNLAMEPGLINNLTDISVGAGGRIYLAESGAAGVGSIVVVDDAVDGTLTIDSNYDLSASPQAIAVTGGIIAIAGDDGYLHLINTADVEWNDL